MRKLKNKKGFTLVEVVVAMAITTIIIVATANLFTSASQVITSLRSDENLDIVCDSVNVYVRNSIDAATDTNIVGLSAAVNSVTDFEAQGNAELAMDSNDKHKIYAIAVIDGKLYDFGEVTTSSLTAALNSPNNYRVYNSQFYNSSSLNVNFTAETELTGLENYAKWLKISSQCMDSNGNISNQPRTITFKLLGGKAKLPNNVDLSDNFVIVYRKAVLSI